MIKVKQLGIGTRTVEQSIKWTLTTSPVELVLDVEKIITQMIPTVNSS